MSGATDRAALGELLRARREALRPGDLGLADDGRRRTPGLRREEVARLANVSDTYYAYLEQGRPVRPSEQVLDAVADALRLTAAERRYLRTLAHAPAADTPPRESVHADVLAFVTGLDPAPTVLKGRRWDVLTANDAARELFGDWTGAADGERNLVRWMFTSPHAREIYLDWEAEARAMLGRFRLAAAGRSADPATARLVEVLHQESELVRAWWPQHDVVAMGGGTKKLRHPRWGPTVYRHVVLTVADAPDQTIVSYTPQP